MVVRRAERLHPERPADADVVDVLRPAGDVADAVVAREACADGLHAGLPLTSTSGSPSSGAGRSCDRLDVAARRGHDRVDDLHVAGAAAVVAAERLEHLVALDRAALALDQRGRGDDHPGRAEAALRGVVVVERGLHRRERLGLAEALERRDRRAVDRRDGRQARAARLAVDEHGARAAAALLAAGLRARDLELLAQDVQQRRERRARDLVLDRR